MKDFEFVITFFEKCCAVKDYGRGVGACRFFNVQEINRLIEIAGPDSGFQKTNANDYQSLCYPVDDVGDLCKLLLRKSCG